jgi:hypothetical protein
MAIKANATGACHVERIAHRFTGVTADRRDMILIERHVGIPEFGSLIW